MKSKYYLTFNTKTWKYDVCKVENFWFIKYSRVIKSEYSLEDAVILLKNLKLIEGESQ